MAINNERVKYSLYVPQGKEKTTYNAFQNSGIDVFASANTQNPDGFFTLDNVLPAVNGGFLRRWGAAKYANLPLGGVFSTPVTRLFPYQVSAEGAIAGDPYSGFNNYYSILAATESGIEEVYSEGTLDHQKITGLSTSIYAALSRGFLYAFDGQNSPQKKHFAAAVAQSSIGIPEASITLSVTTGTGSGFTGTPTITFSGIGTTPPTVSFTIVNGTIIAVNLTSASSADWDGTTTAVISGGGGTGAFVTPFVNAAGSIVAVGLNGPMTFNVGRTYCGAFKASSTGHVSDVTFPSPAIIGSYQTTPIYQDATSSFFNAGVTQIAGSIQISATLPDPLVDTFILLATSDGGDLLHLYEVAQIPISSFTPSGPDLVYNFVDSLPDTFNDFMNGTTTTNTLLENNLWADVDSYGNTVGIIDNTPPLVTVSKPIVNQGRMFATDGKSVFFSKSINEVTTSTGLITSKWEEAWPSANRLDIGFDNEIITGMLSDTTFLYIGTTQNIYRLNGVDINSFSLQCIFRNVGLLDQDSWTVIYKEGIPAGYMWVTPNYKVMLSDFNTYEDVGKPIYPLLSEPGLAPSLQPLLYGPYSMVAVKNVDVIGTVGPIFIFNTITKGWYTWTVPSMLNGPCLSYTKSTGITNLFFVSNPNNPSPQAVMGYFDPTINEDTFSGSSVPITWTIRTGWNDLGDNTNLKVINKLEVWSQETSPVNTTIYCRNGELGLTDNTTASFSQSKATISGPFSRLTSLHEAYYAGLSTAGRLFSFGFSASVSSTVPSVLDQFSVESFPFGRF